ncbi:MAG: hypothetical protein R2710_01165 [Acidimicrobiales bacterium]
MFDACSWECRGGPAAASILHADLDAFYASVEQRDRPDLRGVPMAVGGGVILSASYEARVMGVRTAMPIRMARECCPQLISVSPRMEAYSEASRAVFEIFEDTTPLVEPISIDEAFLDVSGLWRLVGSPEQIAFELRRRVADEVGLPISVGVARTKFLAKVASGVCKPNGLLVVEPDGELGFLHPLPVGRLWGVGPKTAAKLAERGSPQWGRSPTWARRRWCPCWARDQAAIFMLWPTTATPGESSRANDDRRSARSGHWDDASVRSSTSRGCCSNWSIGCRGGCATAIESVAP